MVIPRSWAPLMVESTETVPLFCPVASSSARSNGTAQSHLPSEAKAGTLPKGMQRANSAGRSRHGSRTGIGIAAFNNLPMARNGRHRRPFELSAEVRSGTADHHLRNQMRFRTSSKTSNCPVCRCWCADPHKHGHSTLWIASTTRRHGILFSAPGGCSNEAGVA